jgi:hypothetical protein
VETSRKKTVTRTKQKKKTHLKVEQEWLQKEKITCFISLTFGLFIYKAAINDIFVLELSLKKASQSVNALQTVKVLLLELTYATLTQVKY